MLELRALQVNGVYRRYWLLLAALAVIRARLHPERAKEIDERAAEKLTSVLYKIISSQVDPSVAIPLPVQPQPLTVPEVDTGLYDQNLMVSLLERTTYRLTSTDNCCRIWTLDMQISTWVISHRI